MIAIDMLTRALRAVGNVGSGETPNADDINTALLAANDMLDSWSSSKLYVFQMLEESFALTAGQGAYQIGPGGDFVTVRPTAVQSAFVRRSGLDYPLEAITNDAYSSIGMKAGFQGIPQFFYYNPTIPTGELSIWPTPQSGLTLYMQSPQQLTQFVDLTTDLILPPGYAEAIRYSLMPRLAAEGLGVVNADQIAIAKSSVDRLQTLNSNVPVLRTGASNGRFNIYGNK